MRKQDLYSQADSQHQRENDVICIFIRSYHLVILDQETLDDELCIFSAPNHTDQDRLWTDVRSFARLNQLHYA